MPFWESMMKGGAEGLAKGFGSLAKDIRTAITGQEAVTAEQRIKILDQLEAMEKRVAEFDTAVVQGQNAVNLEEAKSTDKFKSWWRPAVGWVCVLGLLVTFIIRPLLPWCMQVAAITFGSTVVLPPIPEIPMGDLSYLLLGMLGLGGMRTFEKVKGLNNK